MGSKNGTATAKNTEEQETLDAAAALIAAQTDKHLVNEVTLSNGIVLNIMPVPPLTMRYAAQAFPRPKPPVVEIEGKGRSEENPDHPDYKAALLEWSMRQQDISTNILLGMGTSVKSVPKGMFKPKEDGWIESLEAVGIDVNTDSEMKRYLSWVRYYALVLTDDMNLAALAVARHIGVREEDVAAAMASFPGVTVGGADNGDSAERNGANGDSVPASGGGAGSGS